MAFFCFEAPVVSYLGVDNNARTMTGIVTVSGVSFGQSDNTPSSRVDSHACATVAWASRTTVACASTHGFPSVLSVVVTVGAQGGTRLPAFTFDGVPPPAAGSGPGKGPGA